MSTAVRAGHIQSCACVACLCVQPPPAVVEKLAKLKSGEGAVLAPTEGTAAAGREPQQQGDVDRPGGLQLCLRSKEDAAWTPCDGCTADTYTRAETSPNPGCIATWAPPRTAHSVGGGEDCTGACGRNLLQHRRQLLGQCVGGNGKCGWQDEVRPAGAATGSLWTG
jgi:hypothetical protein